MSEWLQQSIGANPFVLLNKINALMKSVFLLFFEQNPSAKSRIEDTESK